MEKQASEYLIRIRPKWTGHILFWVALCRPSGNSVLLDSVSVSPQTYTGKPNGVQAPEEQHGDITEHLSSELFPGKN